jgi:hypothetical protein
MTVIAMLLLAWGKLVVGRQLRNPVISAESGLPSLTASRSDRARGAGSEWFIWLVVG